jgi:transposase
MPQRLRLADHLSDADLFARSRASDHPVERTHYQVLWMVCQGWRTEDIGVAVGYTPTWIRRLVGPYNEQGPSALRDHRQFNPGAAPLLSWEEEQDLKNALANDPPEGDFWSGPLVARWMSERTGQKVARQRGWDYLRRLGYTPQRPRPRHQDADREAQEAFKSGAA